MSWRRKPEYARHGPNVAMGLLQIGNLSTLVRMVREQSALGQSVVAWCLYSAMLVLWLWYYHVCTPTARPAIVATRVGLTANLILLGAVVYFRQFGGQ
jgi:hypothetical protein